MPLISLEYVDTLDANNKKKVLNFSTSLLKEPVNKSSLFVIRVDGKSMQPVILDRTLVVADLSQREIKDGEIYLVYYDNKMWIKKAKKELHEMTFVSINIEYAHLVYRESEVRVVAKAVLSFNTF